MRLHPAPQRMHPARHMRKLPASPRPRLIHHAQVPVQKHASQPLARQNPPRRILPVRHRVQVLHRLRRHPQMPGNRPNLLRAHRHHPIPAAVPAGRAIHLRLNFARQNLKRGVRMMVGRQPAPKVQVLPGLRGPEPKYLRQIGNQAQSIRPPHPQGNPPLQPPPTPPPIVVR